MTHPKDLADAAKTRRLEELRGRYPELLKRGRVMELALGLGVQVWTVRTLMDGPDAVLQPQALKKPPLQTGRAKMKKKRKPPHRYYLRERVFEVLGLV